MEQPELAPLDEAFSGIPGAFCMEILRLCRVIDMCMTGITLTRDAEQTVEIHVRIADVLKKPPPWGTPERYPEALAHARSTAESASREHKGGYSYVYGLGTIKLWALAEAAIDDIVANRLSTPEKCPEQDFLRGLKLPYAVLSEHDPEAKGRILLSCIKEKYRTRQRPDATPDRGIGRFESLLGVVGLSGNIPNHIGRAFAEVCAVRNILVHRRGRVDHEFLVTYPFTPLALGDEFPINALRFDAYWRALMWYGLELETRMHAALGLPLQERVPDLQAKYGDAKSVVPEFSPAEKPAQCAPNPPEEPPQDG